MDTIVIQGVYRKNSRGRAYLFFKDRQRNLRIVRMSARTNIPNGQTITVIGSIQDGRLLASRIQSHNLPVKKSERRSDARPDRTAA
ncbi:MAG: hypothetical protein KDK30_01660 [Leptospiraceae bacterium]|nr:hypothetical protein [Leptospiraceae bacterium]MCB1316762.1 hypothetical protein [Leptospiraceae bacterium]